MEMEKEKEKEKEMEMEMEMEKEKKPISKNNIIITFGEGIDILRKLYLWDDYKIFISELVIRVLQYKLERSNIIILRIKVLDNENTWNILDLDMVISDYLMKYQTIDERQLFIEYGFVN